MEIGNTVHGHQYRSHWQQDLWSRHVPLWQQPPYPFSQTLLGTETTDINKNSVYHRTRGPDMAHGSSMELNITMDRDNRTGHSHKYGYHGKYW